MANPRRASTVRVSKAKMAADLGPYVTHYNTPLDTPVLYKWFVGDVSTIDNLTVLGHQGGTVGRWKLVRTPLLGTDLTDADENLTVGGNFFRVLPAAIPLTAARGKTLLTTNAEAGDAIHILRLGLGAFALNIINDGPAAGTLFALPSGQSWWAKSYFDGTDWIAHSAGQLP
jgi:hypothetical protein